MATGFSVGFYWYQIGMGGFLFSFFSTAAYRLENGKRGSIYPYIMNELYNGTLKNEHIDAAIVEFNEIKNRLSQLPPGDIIWNIEDLNMRPPIINNEASNLAFSFITSDGDFLLDKLYSALQKAKELNMDLHIESY